MTIITRKTLTELKGYFCKIDGVADGYLLKKSTLNKILADVEAQAREDEETRTNTILKEINLVITSWMEDLGLEKDWEDDLHPADILDKHVFRQLERKIG